MGDVVFDRPDQLFHAHSVVDRSGHLGHSFGLG
jgi:hypothetical protein